jgi:hypothetical protein
MPKKTMIFADQKFGKLTVLKDTDDRYVGCICECGREISVLKQNLTSGKSKSCGKGVCQSGFNDLSGKIFGYLTALEVFAWSNGKSPVIWKCLCICGNYCNVKSDNLRDMHTKSCGCKRSILISESISLPPGEINVRQLFANYRNGANNRKLDFFLTLEEFREFIFKNCHYCGSPPVRLNTIENIQQENSIHYNGIDRVNNNIGYQTNNCITCCKICNYAKSSMSYDDFIIWIGSLIEYRSKL